jgi:cell division protein FtsW (lipid II flippase)
MSRYADRIIHYCALILFVIGLAAIFSGYSIPRIVYYGGFENPPAMWHTLRPIFFTVGVGFVGLLVYLYLSAGKFPLDWKPNSPRFVNLLTNTTLVLMVFVVAERYIFHLRFNRWLLGPKHMILITGLVITAFFIFLAYQFSKEKINYTRLVVISFLFILLLWKQPDHGTAFLFVAAIALLLYMTSNNKWVIRFFKASISSVIIVALISVVNSGLNIQIPNIFHSYVIVRINNWLNPFSDVVNKSYQIANSLYAVHKGGLLGKGYGFGVRKLYMGATVHTDFIFATIGEELGFVFSAFIFIVTLLLLLRLLNLAYRFKSKFESYFTLLVALETFAMALMNAGMAVNLLPSKGWPYPLISYGPFFLIFYIIQLGLVQYMVVNRFAEIYGKGRR